MQLVYMYMDSPVGALKLVAHDQALVAVMWDNEDHKRVRLAELVENVQQQQVWRALLTIPFGETRSYKEIAVQLGNEKAVRAVGAANGKNPISIIAPCHRVIGSSGALVGFAGGLDKKQILLSLEQSQTL